MAESMSPYPLAVTFLPLQGALADSVFIPTRKTGAPFFKQICFLMLLRLYCESERKKKKPSQSVTLSVPNECASLRDVAAILLHRFFPV